MKYLLQALIIAGPVWLVLLHTGNGYWLWAWLWILITI